MKLHDSSYTVFVYIIYIYMYIYIYIYIYVCSHLYIKGIWNDGKKI